MADRLKILISAYACSPVRGSEPGVGWGVVMALARFHDLWVIVESEKFQKEIEDELKKDPAITGHINFFFIHKKRNRPLRKIWPPSYYWYYRKWHLAAYELALKLHKEIDFDLAHQLTMVGFREPGYLWKLGVPFVWGPVGGMGFFPWRFLVGLGLKGGVYYLGYNLFNFLQMRFLPRPRQAAAIANLITATPENKKGATRHWQAASEVICEVGLPASAFVSRAGRRDIGAPLSIIWSGLHTPRKALDISLRALSLLPEGVDCRLHILGQGEMTENWQRLANKLGVANKCIFHGWQPRDKAMAIMQSGNVMLITSLRDLTSTVTIESLAMGLPVICLDHCGFSHVVNDACGVKISVSNPGKVVKDIAAAIEKLCLNESLRYKLAQGALLRAADFTWDQKVEQINKVYQQALHGK